MDPELSVRNVLTKEFVGVSESDTVLGAVALMREERVGCVLAMRGSEPVGIMTEWDVLGLVSEERDPADTTVGDVMSSPVLSIDAGRSVADAADRMTRESIRNLVVEDESGIVGILTQRDVIAVAGSTTSSPTDAVVDPAVDESSDAELTPNGGDEYTTQGVCELCGSLADSLWESNGQLVCSDCRTV